jgi:hypothetical protein
MIKMGEMR